jgi:archaemetzincin
MAQRAGASTDDVSALTSGARAIALAPFGEVKLEKLESLREIVRETLGRDLIVHDPLELPRSAFDLGRGQYRSTSLLDTLAKIKRPGCERVLGVAEVDLYVPELNFVFGEADSARGVAVFSVARLAPAKTEELFRRRVATEALHELAHSYGLGHCRRSDCVMWFSNTLAETDRKGTSFCAEHRAQLSRAIGTR